MSSPRISWLPDRRRLHMNHGPIDLVVEAFGAEDERRVAYAQAAARFRTVLDELVAELQKLRRPSAPNAPRRFAGPTARRMEAACAPLSESFITPMAAVAGSVADEMLAALVAGRDLDRAYVNDGGDIAIHLAPGQSMRLAIAGTGHGFADRVEIDAASPVRGVATSGWRGRSFSLGIADAVTVLARSGAEADAAATMIANAVDLPGHRAIERKPANELAPDSDLGGRLVTVGVGPLTPVKIAQALEAGLVVADDLRQRGLIEAAALFLAGDSMICGIGAAPSTMLRMVPLPRFAGEEPAPTMASTWILPRVRGRGTAPPGPAEGRPEDRLRWWSGRPCTPMQRENPCLNSRSVR